jgi:hypothetical protein
VKPLVAGTWSVIPLLEQQVEREKAQKEQDELEKQQFKASNSQ